MTTRDQAAGAIDPSAIPAAPRRRLPGEIVLDQQLVERAVLDLNRLYAEKGLDMILAIGQYLLDTFFAGDFGGYRSRSRRHISFRRLAERHDIHIPASVLYRSVAILEQVQQLPESVVRQLSVAHHRALLVVKDPDQKVSLARHAIDARLSFRALQRQVQKVVKAEGRVGRGGRPRLPPLVKSLRRLHRDLTVEDGDIGGEKLLEYFAIEDLVTVAEVLNARLTLVNEVILRHEARRQAIEIAAAEGVLPA